MPDIDDRPIGKALFMEQPCRIATGNRFIGRIGTSVTRGPDGKPGRNFFRGAGVNNFHETPHALFKRDAQAIGILNIRMNIAHGVVDLDQSVIGIVYGNRFGNIVDRDFDLFETFFGLFEFRDVGKYGSDATGGCAPLALPNPASVAISDLE